MHDSEKPLCKTSGLQQGIHLGVQQQLHRLRVVRDRRPAERGAAVAAARVDVGGAGQEQL